MSKIVGCSFSRKGSREVFEVLEGVMYEARKITPRYRDFLLSLPPLVLVSVSFWSHPTPLISVNGGVVKLTRVRDRRGEYTQAAAISAALGIGKTKDPHQLVRVTG